LKRCTSNLEVFGQHAPLSFQEGQHGREIPWSGIIGSLAQKLGMPVILIGWCTDAFSSSCEEEVSKTAAAMASLCVVTAILLPRRLE
jgi:hypothetical protein